MSRKDKKMKQSIRRFSMILSVVTFVIVSTAMVAPTFLTQAKVFAWGTMDDANIATVNANEPSSSDPMTTEPEPLPPGKSCGDLSREQCSGQTCPTQGGAPGHCRWTDGIRGCECYI